jgi:hypothetical protein
MKFIRTTLFFLIVTIVLLLAVFAAPFGMLFEALSIGFDKGRKITLSVTDRCLDDIKRNIPSKP